MVTKKLTKIKALFTSTLNMDFLTVLDDCDAIESNFSPKNSDEIGLFCVSHFPQNKRSVYEKFQTKIKIFREIIFWYQNSYGLVL